MRQRQQPGQESMKMQRDKRGTAQDRVCRVWSVWGSNRKPERRCTWIRILIGIPECEQQKLLVLLKKQKGLL